MTEKKERKSLIDGLQKQIHALMEQRADLMEEAERAATTIRQANTAKSLLSAAKASYEEWEKKKKEEKLVETKRYQAELEQLREERRNIEADIRTKIQETNRRESEVQVLESEHASLDRQVAQKTKERDDLEAKNVQLHRRNHETAEELRKATIQLQELQTKCRDQQEVIKMEGYVHDQRQKSLDTYEKTLSRRATDLEIYRNKLQRKATEMGLKLLIKLV